MENIAFQRLLNRAYDFNEEQQKALDEGKITEEEWYEINKQFSTSHYLASDNPRGQSGHSGDEYHYFQSHLLLLGALHKNGTFLDVGCANGYLAESLDRWTKSLGYYSITYYGLDISEGLIDLAIKRLPEWKDRFFVGNALTWRPAAQKFDFVCVKELCYVPKNKQQRFLEHLLEHYVAPGGRLIIGPYGEHRETHDFENKLSEWGYTPSGYVERSHQKHHLIARRILWFDKE